MAKITWKGDDDFRDGEPGPTFCVSYDGTKFPKGVPVEVTDKEFIAMARMNPFYEVSGIPGRPPKVETADV